MVRDDEKREDEEQKAGKSRSLPILIGATVLALLLGAGGTYLVLRPDAEAKEGTAPSETVEEEAPAPPAEAPFQERVFALDPFVVNVAGNDYARYLKLKVELEVDSPAVNAELEGRLPQLRDAVILLLSSKRLSDITDFEGKALLKQDILERVNALLETGRVRDVLFTEFVVQ